MCLLTTAVAAPFFWLKGDAHNCPNHRPYPPDKGPACQQVEDKNCQRLRMPTDHGDTGRDEVEEGRDYHKDEYFQRSASHSLTRGASASYTIGAA